MKRAAFAAILSLAVWAGTEAAAQTGQQSQPAGQTPQAATKRPPQAKTQPEFDAWKAASASNDPATMEKSADDFAAKFPDSELRVLLYKNGMRVYQRANNAEKTETMGRKVLALDPDDPEALTTVAEVIAEKTRDTDIDTDQRYADGVKMAERGLQTIDTDVSVPAGTTPQQLDAYKSGLRSQAYSTIGTIEYNRGNFAAAEANFQKAIDAVPSDPYALDVLHLALALDKEQKYPEALKVANRAVDMTQDNTPIGTPARRERDRLQQLTGTAPAQGQPPKN